MASYRRWLAGAALVLALGVLGWPTASFGALKAVGDEQPVGKNRTGEDCRLRFVQKETGSVAFERFSLFCEGWNQPSGEIVRVRVARGYTAEKMLTDSGYQKSLDRRLAECGPVEPTTLAGGDPGALKTCRRMQGGWTILVVGAILGSHAYGLETFPTNLPLLELAVELLEGKRSAAQPGAPPLSAAIRRAETLVGANGRLIGIQDVGAHGTLYRLGELQNWSAHYPESEVTFRRLLDLEERLLGRDTPPSGNTLAWIALDLSGQRRFAEADQFFARAEPLVVKSLSADDHPRYLTFRSFSEHRRGRFDEALRYAESAVRGREARGPDTPGMALSLVALANAQLGLKRYDDVEVSAGKALAIVGKPGPLPEFRLWWASEASETLGWAHVGRQRYADARQAFGASLERRRLLLGDSVRVTWSLHALGYLSRLEGDQAGSLAAYRQAAEIQAKDRPTRERTRPDDVAGYLNALFEAAQASPDQREALFAEAFAAIQLPRGGDTARAITNMAARLDAADPAVRAAAREFQETTRERERVRHALTLETVKEPDKREPAKEEALKRELRDAEEKLARLEERLQAELPRYAQLTAPRPLTVAELSPLLRPGESLLAFLPTRTAVYVLLVRDGRVAAHRASVSAADLDALVHRARAGVDVGDGRLQPFDVAAAHRLYDLLVAPVAAGLAGTTHLIVVPAGPLLSMPFGFLVTRPASAPAAADGDYRQVPWLAREMAISVVPAPTALKALRQVAGHSSAPRPFIGFGDPIFAGVPGDTRSAAAIADLCRQGDPVDADLVRGLPRLRETARELTLIGRALGAEPGSVILGADASESKVRAADLAQYRIISFATHGLLPGELKCKSEPALALTPPATASAADDGLLDASEVAQLKLDADWVLLSACNTASPGGKLGGESLSGLARAFFYAGARALLVSHWAVASRATVALMTGTFQAQAQDATVGRAEALRRAQLALAADPDTSHPFFWAPFVLVGDGGAATTR